MTDFIREAKMFPVLEEYDSEDSGELSWYVAHTKSRAEKKLQQHCLREAIEVSLPCVVSVRKYQSKVARFDVPLFPGYVFVRMSPAKKQSVLQSNYCARLLDVPDQAEFASQLDDIQTAVSSDVEVCLAPQIIEGVRIVVKTGPLRGVEGFVEKRSGVVDVFLRLDFIAKAALVRMHVSELELL